MQEVNKPTVYGFSFSVSDSILLKLQARIETRTASMPPTPADEPIAWESPGGRRSGIETLRMSAEQSDSKARTDQAQVRRVQELGGQKHVVLRWFRKPLVHDSDRVVSKAKGSGQNFNRLINLVFSRAGDTCQADSVIGCDQSQGSPRVEWLTEEFRRWHQHDVQKGRLFERTAVGYANPVQRFRPRVMNSTAGD